MALPICMNILLMWDFNMATIYVYVWRYLPLNSLIASPCLCLIYQYPSFDMFSWLCISISKATRKKVHIMTQLCNYFVICVYLCAKTFCLSLGRNYLSICHFIFYVYICFNFQFIGFFIHLVIILNRSVDVDKWKFIIANTVSTKTNPVLCMIFCGLTNKIDSRALYKEGN